MICMFSDRDVNKVLEHLNTMEDVQVINILLVGTKYVAFYKVKKKEPKLKQG